MLEFPSKGRMQALLQKLRDTGSVDRHPGSGRRCSTCSADNIFYELVLRTKNLYTVLNK